jgi:hypothetical protein
MSLAWCLFPRRADAAAPGIVEDGSKATRDYDAPDPNRGALTALHAFANVIFVDYVLFQIDWFRDVEWITVTRRSIGNNLRGDPGFDYDPLYENLLRHPLQGSLTFNAARATGLSFWESSVYPLIGSLAWDYSAERRLVYPGGWTSKPSVNDIVTTSTAGIILGETFYRLSSYVLDDSTSGAERAVREVLAGFVSPARGFSRLTTGEMWRSGAPPERSHPLLLALDVGMSHLTERPGEGSGTGLFTNHPTGLVAVEVEYGDLLPKKRKTTLGPFEFFEGYASQNLFDEGLSGSRVFVQGLLHGWSSDISVKPAEEVIDNNVFGFVQTFDYQVTNGQRFGALSLGPADYVKWRFGGRRSLRLGMDVDWTYLAGISSPFADSQRGYKYAMGAGVGCSARLELARHGRLALRSRQYLTHAVDGQSGDEVFWYGRLSYDVDLAPHVGLGISPTLMGHSSSAQGKTATAASLDTQLYLRVHL